MLYPCICSPAPLGGQPGGVELKKGGDPVAIVDPKTIGSLIVGSTPWEYERLQDLLVQVFDRLPQEDAEILIEKRRVRFILASTSHAIYLPEGDHWLLVLNSKFFKNPQAEKIYVIAHEMAHAFLKHQGSSSAKHEFLTDRQVVRWGFEHELESVPNSYLRGSGIEDRYGITITGEVKR
jgi:hypothetical protein